MGSAFLKLLTLTLFLDIFIFLILGYAVSVSPDNFDTAPATQGTFFDVFFEDPDGSKASLTDYVANMSNEEGYTTGYKMDMAGNFSNPPFPEGGTTVQLSSGGFSFIDGIKTTGYRQLFLKNPLIILWKAHLQWLKEFYCNY